MTARHRIAALAAATALSTAGTPAFAQTEPQAATDIGSGDIIVNAQRRSERLVDVPIAITTLTAEALTSAQITSTTDLDRLTPGLLFPMTGNQTQPTIRGVGSTFTAPGSENTVAIYVDGVYQPHLGSLQFDLANVQQVEVLKGPQGTLFGRNATGGAITIKTFDPNVNQPEFRVGVNYGRFNDLRLNGYVNLPLTDQMAVNMASYYRHSDGYVRNLFTGKNVDGHRNLSFNGKILWEPDPDFRAVISGIYSDRDFDISNTNAPYRGLQNAYLSNPALAVPGTYETNQNDEPVAVSHTRAVSLKAEWNTGVGTLSSITAYEHFYNRSITDGDFTPAASVVSLARDDDKTFSQEVNFASEKFGAFSFIAGLYYFHDNAIRRQIVSARIGSTPQFVNVAGRIITDAYAAYAEATFDITDRLHLIAGARYSDEKREVKATRFTTNTTVNGKRKDHATTPRFSIRYEVLDNANVYATYSKGFKSGQFNAVALDTVGIKPEKIDAYEIGFKISRPGFRFNTSAFYYNYKNIQVLSSLGVGQPVFANAGKSKNKGADFDFSAKLTDAFSISGGAAYTHAKYKEFLGSLTTVRSPTTGLFSAIFTSAAGNTMQRTPKLTATLSGNYDYVTESGTFGATASVSHNSGFYTTADNTLKHPDYQMVSAELSWTSPDDMYRLALWGKNLAKAKKALVLTNGASGFTVIWDEPRTFGVSATVKLLK